LLFQGFSQPNYLADFKKMLAEHRVENVIVSDTMYDRLDDIFGVVQSCDLGIAWYNNISANFRTAGKSSGKIPAYLKCGLPVVANRYPSTIDAIEKTGCGLCIETLDELEDALANILENYEQYAFCARTEYERTYRFENYSRQLVDFIEG